MGLFGRWFSFSGRIGRSGYWLGRVPLAVVFFLGLDAATELDPTRIALDASLLPGLVATSVALWIGSATSVKRWHDLDRSGLWALIEAVPLIGFVLSLLILGLVRGSPGENRWGAPSPSADGEPVTAPTANLATDVAAGNSEVDAIFARWTASNVTSQATASYRSPRGVAAPAPVAARAGTTGGFGRRGAT